MTCLYHHAIMKLIVKLEVNMSHLFFQRLDNILNYLLIQTDPVTLDNLSQVTKVSSRTLRSDIKTINDHIVSHGAEIILLRKKGYVVTYQDKAAFHAFWSKDNSGTFLFTTADARLRYLLRIFLTSDTYITQDALLNILYVSQNTLYNDFRTLRDILANYKLKLINKSNLGYTLVGEEQDIRYAINHAIFQEDLSEFITATNTVEKDICMNIDYQQFNTLFWHDLNPLIKVDSDYFHRNAFANLLLTVSRISDGYTLDFFEQDVSLTAASHEKIVQFVANLENAFQIKFNASEKKYVDYILSENFPHLITSDANHANQQLAEDIVNSILSNLKKNTGAKWVTDASLKQNLKKHIRRLLQIHTINGNRHNPILESVKNNFPYPFELAVIVIQEVEDTYGISFSEDELSFIALYFASAIESFKDKRNSFSLAIVCGTGITLSSIIESKIRRKFPDTFSDIEKISYLEFEARQSQAQFDLIITTIPIPNKAPHIIFLDINYFDTAFKQIERAINTLSTVVPPTSLYQDKHFYVINDQLTKAALLTKMHDALADNAFVSDHFIQQIIAREAISDTLINDVIALPHPIGDSVKISTIFPVIAPKGIEWGDSKRVKFIFFMAIRPDDVSKVQYVYDALLDFISSEKKQDLLLKTPTFDTLVSLLTINDDIM